jgi:nucleoside-diphosphate-sugar epimerase
MVLLTGASGFIGKHLLAALISKYGKDNVLALTSAPLTDCRYLLHLDYSFGSGYFADNGYADSITTIIHAGAFTPKNSAQANDWKQSNSNIHNTAVLLEADLPRLEKFIYLSTLDVYGNDEIISENSTVAPASLYGHSKLYGEKMVTAWANDKKVFAQILRVGHVYGPGEEAYQKIIPVTAIS